MPSSPASGSTSRLNAISTVRPDRRPGSRRPAPSDPPPTAPATPASTTSVSVSVSTVEPDRGRHRRVGGEARLAHRGVGDQRVRGQQRAEQDRRLRFPAQPQAHARAERPSGSANVSSPKHDRRAPVAAQQVEVELDPGDEHQVQQPAAGRGPGSCCCPSRSSPSAVGADHIAAEQQPDDPRHPRPPHAAPGRAAAWRTRTRNSHGGALGRGGRRASPATAPCASAIILRILSTGTCSACPSLQVGVQPFAARGASIVPSRR